MQTVLTHADIIMFQYFMFDKHDILVVETFEIWISNSAWYISHDSVTFIVSSGQYVSVDFTLQKLNNSNYKISWKSPLFST